METSPTDVSRNFQRARKDLIQFLTNPEPLFLTREIVVTMNEDRYVKSRNGRRGLRTSLIVVKGSFIVTVSVMVCHL